MIYDLNGIKSRTKRQLLPVGVNASPFQADYDHPAKLKNLVAESRNSAILDSRASNTITGESWINTYIESLEDQGKAKIVFRDSTNVYRFGDATILATRHIDIPVVIGSKQFTLNIDAVPNDIPLLLSKKSMKTANMTLNFKNDNTIIFGEPEQLIVRKLGHYAIPISPYNKILNNVTNGSNANVTLIATRDRSKQETALKLTDNSLIQDQKN